MGKEVHVFVRAAPWQAGFGAVGEGSLEQPQAKHILKRSVFCMAQDLKEDLQT